MIKLEIKSVTVVDALIEALREFYPDVTWRVSLFDSNGEPLARSATIAVTVTPVDFARCASIISDHIDESERHVTGRVRNVMAKNLQHGMRVEFLNGQIGVVNQWWMDKGVIGIGAPGGLTMELEPGQKVRVHP